MQTKKYGNTEIGLSLTQLDAVGEHFTETMTFKLGLKRCVGIGQNREGAG